MANPQKQYLEFHHAIKLGRYDQEDFLRQKRDLLLNTLKSKLEQDNDLPQLIDCFNQGSYALGTGIKPTNGDYDIDVGVLLSCNKDDFCPVELKKCIRDLLLHNNRTVEIKRSCVTVTYLINGQPDYHVDLPIYATDYAGNKYLAKGKEFSNAENKLWVLSSPTELIETIKAKFSNDSRKQFRRCVRYLKKWRNEYATLGFFKSIAITSAVYAYMDTLNLENDNQTLINVLSSLTSGFIHYTFDQATEEWYYRLRIDLPAHPGVDLLEKVTKSQMQSLQTLLTKLKQDLDSVHSESDTKVACEKLQKIFGSNFPISDISELSKVTAPSYIKTGSSA